MNDNLIFENKSEKTYDVSVISGIGRRDIQQDSGLVIADDTQVYAVVCDGMGGLGGGERASKLAIEDQLNYFSINRNNTDNTWMLNAIMDADMQVSALKTETGERLGGGSTCTAVRIIGNQLFWASVGDSRAYIFSGGEHRQLTTDLNYQFYLDNYPHSIEDEDRDPEALISFLGLGGLELIDRNDNPFILNPGDIVLICSDGIYRTVDPDWMEDVLHALDNVDEIVNMVDAIIKENNYEYQDNYTCILIRINPEESI